MPKRIILIRHGETDDNLNRIFQGWKDTDLNPTGLKQAKLLAKRLAKESIDAIYSSDLLRAYNTARPLAKQLKLPVIKTSKLREHSLGLFEGHRWDDLPQEMKLLWDELVTERNKLNLHWKKHKGESFHEFMLRIKNLINELKSKHADKSVALVTHGGTINRTLEILKLKKIEGEYLSLENTSITIFQKHRANFKIAKLNDTSHLDGGSSQTSP